MRSRGSEESPLIPLGSMYKGRISGLTCVKSKSALLILAWNFSVLLVFRLLHNNGIIQTGKTSSAIMLVDAASCVIFFFSPMAGLLADAKFGRHKTVLCSTYTIFSSWCILPLLLLVIGLKYNKSLSVGANIGNNILISTVIALVVFALVFSTIMFLTNAIPFGMNQLHDLSTEDSILYIHWYVWVYYTSSVLVEITWNLIFYDYRYIGYLNKFRLAGVIMVAMIFFAVLLLLIFSLFVVHCQKRWFVIESRRVNPYKMVYKVIRFACKHKTPVYRSAFTYCEDEIPSRLDLGKSKYGGPFTTEQVEDVKAFLGILKVIVSMGPLLMLQAVLNVASPMFSQHGYLYFEYYSKTNTTKMVHIEGAPRYILISNGVLSPLLVVVSLPLYLCVIRPHILFRIPGMFKRIGMGLLLMQLSLFCYFSMDLFVHTQHDQPHCMFLIYRMHSSNDSISSNDIPSNDVNSLPTYQNVYFLTSQLLLSALFNMLIDVGIFEFIFSQSPHSLKGLLVGSFFSIRSLFQAAGMLSVIPFGSLWSKNIKSSLSCGSGFYITHMIIGMIAFITYVWVARKYKYRKRDEPHNEYRYAEEYYSNIQ